MRAKVWPLAVGIGLAGFSVPAAADLDWSRPAWYIALTADFGQGPRSYLYDGPYSTEADCKAAWSAMSPERQKSDGSCEYFASDPWAD